MSLEPSSDPELSAAIFDAAVDGILVIDSRGIVRAINHAAQKAFGYAADELIGKNVSVLMPPRDAAAHDTYIQNFERTGEAHIVGIGREVLAKRKSGEYFPIYLSIGQYTEDGERRYVGICHDESERRRHIERIAYLARHDGLTGILNRNQIMHLLDTQLRSADAKSTQVGAIFVDLDGFKQVNDRHGHDIGDRMLREVAIRLRATLQNDQVVGRMGGDEFAIILPDMRDLAQAKAIAQRVLGAISLPIKVDDLRLNVSASAGVALYPLHGQNADELMNAADMAMYHAKQTGSTVFQFDPHLREQRAARYRLLEKLRHALDAGEFVLHYQPQFDLQTLQTIGLEALLRWQSPQDGLIPPGQFIPLAIECGLMPLITRWVLRQACTDNASLIAQGLLDAPVAVNVCLPTLFDDTFAEFLCDTLRQTGLPGNRLEVEVTEDVAMASTPNAARLAQSVRGLGVRLAIDDFGVGFSSLGRLKSLYFEMIKIDRSFIAGLPDDRRDASIVRAICGIGAGLNIPVLAEGVETEVQRDALLDLGCTLGQGYWFARPMPFDALVDFLRQQQAAAQMLQPTLP